MLDNECHSLFTLSESLIDPDTSETFKGGGSHNVALSETLLIKQLCNCLDPKQDWCFIHNTVVHKQALSVTKNNAFGFINHVSVPTPLFQPPPRIIDETNLLQWTFDAHRIVSDTN